MIVLAVGLPLLALGCGDQGSDSPLAGAAGGPVAEAEIVTTIGRVTGREEYLFGDVTSVASDTDGRIYVADRIGSSISVFASDGRFLRRLGREGRGPGEYQWPTDVVPVEGDLWIRDLNRITRLAPRSPGAVPDSVAETRRIPGLPGTSSRRARLIGESYYYPRSELALDGPDRYAYLLIGPDGVTDTLPVPDLEHLDRLTGAAYRISRGSARMVEGLNRAPFEPRATWDLTNAGTVVGGSGTEPFLREFAPDGTVLARYELPFGRRPVPDAARADSAAALRRRIDSLPVPFEELLGASELIRNGELPDSLPTHLNVVVGEDGRVWVRIWPGAERTTPAGSDGDGAGSSDPRRTVFFAFEHRGGPLGTIVVPADLATGPPPHFRTIGDRIVVVGVTRDPETEVERVVVAATTPPWNRR